MMSWKMLGENKNEEDWLEKETKQGNAAIRLQAPHESDDSNYGKETGFGNTDLLF